MRWERLGRKVALDVALGLNYLHAQVSWSSAALPVLLHGEKGTGPQACTTLHQDIQWWTSPACRCWDGYAWSCT